MTGMLEVPSNLQCAERVGLRSGNVLQNRPVWGLALWVTKGLHDSTPRGCGARHTQATKRRIVKPAMPEKAPALDACIVDY